MLSNSTIILESVGCAKTLTNSNSSRFMRLVDLGFKETELKLTKFQSICLLGDGGRVVDVPSDERSFHIFYELLRFVPSPIFDDDDEWVVI